MLSMLCCVCETHYHIRFWINKAGGQSHVCSSLPNAEGCIHHWYEPAHTCNLNGDFQFHDGDRLSLEPEQIPQLISSETICTCLDRISLRHPQGIDYFNVLKFHSEYSLFQQCVCVPVCVLVSTLEGTFVLKRPSSRWSHEVAWSPVHPKNMKIMNTEATRSYSHTTGLIQRHRWENG